VTGASAGAINALLSALAWCRRPDSAETAEDNLFRSSWLGVGIDALLPGAPDAWLAEDGLLTRRAFDRAVSNLERAMAEDHYVPGCSLPLAVTVTRTLPGVDVVQGLEVVNSRFAVPLRLKVGGDGRLWFDNDVDAGRHPHLLGQHLYLAEWTRADAEHAGPVSRDAPDTFVPGSHVLRAVLASAAFPVAFSPLVLAQCLPGTAERDPAAACEADLPPAVADLGELTCQGLVKRGVVSQAGPCPARFVDGGFFDNVPLGPAMAQAEARGGRALRAPTYIYFDPDVRRLHSERLEPFDAGDRGLRRFGHMLGGAVATARAYELHGLLRFARFNRSKAHYATGVSGALRALADAGAGRPGPGLTARPGAACLERCLAALPEEPLTAACKPLPAGCRCPEKRAPEGCCCPEKEAADGCCCAQKEASADRPSSCTPADLRRLADGLDRLAKRLACRGRSASIDDGERLGHRRLLESLGARLDGLNACLGKPTPGSAAAHGRLERLRLGADALAQALEVDPYAERRLLLPSRFSPVAAGQLGNFGAFLDEPLRAYDFGAGVYDAIRAIAEERCVVLGKGTRRSTAGDRLDLSARDAWSCLHEQLEAVRGSLGVDRAPTVAHVLDELTAQEEIVAAPSGPEAAGRVRVAPQAAGLPPAETGCPKDADARVCTVHAALTSCERSDGSPVRAFPRADGEPFCVGDFGFQDFVEALKTRGYVAPEGSVMARVLDDPGWWQTPARLMAARLRAVEEREEQAAEARARRTLDEPTRAAHAEAAAGADAVGRLLAVVEAGIRTAARDHSRRATCVDVDLDPSTVPGTGPGPFHLLPFHLGVDAHHGGFVLGWEPRWTGHLVEGRLTVDAVHYRAAGDSWATALAPSVAFRAFWPWVGYAGLGPTLDRTWSVGGWELGAAVHVDLLAEKLRVAVGRRLLHDPDGGAGWGWLPEEAPAWDVRLALLDVPGILYTLTR